MSTLGRAERRATIYDVANLAGVSHQTVSRYLSGFEGIRPATRDKVEKALAELDYRPNQLARSLRTGKPKRIAILAHELGHLGPGRVVQGAIAECRSAGYVVEIVDFDGTDLATLRDSLDFIGHQPVAGILATAQTDDIVHMLREHAVSVPRLVNFKTSFIDTVTVGVEGGLAAGNHLGVLGHRHVAHLSGPVDWEVTRDRQAGFQQAIEAHGGVLGHVMVGDWTSDSGYAAGLAFEPGAHGTAVFAANDHMAIGFIHAMRDRAIGVPEDLSVVGFDDIPEARHLSPALSTVASDFEREGRFGAACLIAEIEGRPRPSGISGLIALVPRESSRAL